MYSSFKISVSFYEGIKLNANKKSYIDDTGIENKY